MDDMIEAVRRAMERAYAPYSDFPVGAVVRSESGKLYVRLQRGELCLSAKAGAPRPRPLPPWWRPASGASSMVAVMGRGEVAMVTPCGGCRQKLREFADDGVVVHVCGPEGLRRSVTLGELLPLAFGPENLR